MSNIESLELAGVPVVVRPPANPSLPATLIVLWHGFGVPNSEEMLAETLPLEEVQAWKAYLGLPLFGFENLKHQLDLEAAKSSPHMQQDMAELQRAVAGWFSQYLTS